MKPGQQAIPLMAARTEAERVARFRSGDTGAFDEILGEYWDAILRYAEWLLRDGDAAYDAAQEAFIRLWLKRHQWTESGTIRAFLYRTTHNLAIDERRKDRTRQLGRVARNARAEATVVRTPAVDLEQEELRRAVEKAVAALPERRREVFIL